MFSGSFHGVIRYTGWHHSVQCPGGVAFLATLVTLRRALLGHYMPAGMNPPGHNARCSWLSDRKLDWRVGSPACGLHEKESSGTGTCYRDTKACGTNTHFRWRYGHSSSQRLSLLQ